MSVAAVSPLERVRALLAPDAEPWPSADGFADLLGGGGGAPPTTAAQRLMTSRVLPLIYERVWRPLGVGLMGGVTRLGLADERTLAVRLQPEEGDAVLDVACGPGNVARRLAERVGDEGLVIGIDASATMLAQAVRETSAANVAYVRGDAQRLPFADASFDAVCCYAALYLFDAPFAAMGEMARVLRPGGRIAILTSCHRGPGLLRSLAGAGPATVGVRVFGRHEVTGELERLGFDDVRQRVSGVAQLVRGRKPS